MRLSRFIGGLLLFACIVSPTIGATQLQLDVGWGNRYRIGRWNPLFVTASDSRQRQTILEIYAPHDRRFAMNVRERLDIGPNPVTIPMLLPLSYMLNETTVVLRDRDSGRRLIDPVKVSPDMFFVGSQRGTPEPISPLQPFIGLSGNPGSERLVTGQFAGTNSMIGYLDQVRLPTTPVGYDALDVLLLNQPDFRRLRVEQQQAIVDWARSGGIVVMWAGPEPVPTSGPLIDALPCTIGDVTMINLERGRLSDVGLPVRFEKITGRTLTRKPNRQVEEVSIFQGFGPAMFRSRVGLGEICVLPMETSAFQFQTVEHAASFWRRVLEGAIEVNVLKKDANNNNSFPGSQFDVRRRAAVDRTLDWLSDIPGAGSFGFSYIAIVLLAMMFIVGPIDWFVLKRLGRQPWTWVTTSGWIGLVTVGAIYMGHVFKSGDLHYRTVSIIDEAGGARVAAVNLASIYAPRTTEYELECAPETWWRPAADESQWYGGDFQTELDFRQDYQGNYPSPLLINVWNLRYIEGVSLAPEPAIVAANLKITGAKIIGTLTNRGSAELRNLTIRTKRGVAQLGNATIPPGATIDVSAMIDRADETFTNPATEAPQWNRQHRDTAPLTAVSICGVAATRSTRIDQIIKAESNIACIYAEFVAPSTNVKLKADGAKELHFSAIRALVSIEGGR